MSHTGAYGQRLGDRFHLDEVATIVTRALRKTEIAVTEIRCDNPKTFMSEPIPREDAFLVALQMRDYPHHEYWEDGRQAPLTSLRAGDTTLYDLKRNPLVLLDKPFHSIHFYLPRSALDALADEAEAPHIGDLTYQPGKGVRDERMMHLGAVAHAAMERPDHASRLFVEHVTLAVGAHVAQTYGGLAPASPPRQGGLATWQEKRARDAIASNLSGELTLASLARECGLSVGHFSRAFKKTTGFAPHQWLLQCRVQAAKNLLRNRDVPLLEVALMTGFSDQSHFTRIFARTTGVSPGAWRRSLVQ